MMSDLHPIGWYSSRIAPHLPKEAFRAVPERLWGGLAYLSVAAAGITAIGMMDLAPWGNLLLAFVIGQAFAGLGFLAHEILHGSVVKTAWLRDLLGCIAFAQFCLGARLWRKWHNMEHHAHTQDHDETDPDAWATMEEMYRRPAMRWAYRLPAWVRATVNFASFSIFFSLHSLLMFRRYIGDFKVKDRPVVWLQLLLPAAFWLALLVVMGPVRWLYAYVIPLLIANFLVICYISTNHQLNPLVPINDPLANSLTVTVPRWMDVLHYNFSYHTEHHLFPGMNPKYAPLVKACAKRFWPDRYHEMPFGQALLTLWRTPRVYYQDTELVDPRESLVYGTLGHRLTGPDVQPRQVELTAPSQAVLSTPQREPVQAE